MEDRYYIIVNGEKIYVSHEVWQDYVSFTNHIHYLAWKAKECRAGKKQMAACNGDCYTCRCYTPKGVSVDTMADCNDRRIGEQRYQDPQMLFRCEEVIADMVRVDPTYGEQIGRMIMDGWQIVDIAAELGIPASTLQDRLHRIGCKIRGV